MVDRELRLGSDKAPKDGLTYFKNSNDTMAAIRRELTQAIVGAEVVVEKEENGPPVGAPVNVEVVGDKYETLAAIAQQLKNSIAGVEGVVDPEGRLQGWPA